MTLNDYSYGFADAAMNQLFGFAYVHSEVGLSAFAWQVFGAFDEGEYLHEDIPADEQGEALTRKLLDEIDTIHP